jgi:hypothetical protein
MFVRSKTVLLSAMLSILWLGYAQGAPPEVLNQIPGDAYAVVVVNNVRTLSDKAAHAATLLKLTVPPDLAGSLTRNFGITGGFDANSSAAIVLLKPAAGHENENYFTSQPPAIFLLPTSDPKSMLEPFTPGDPDKAGITEVTNPANAAKGFVAIIANKWVAFAQTKDVLQAYLGRTDPMSKALTADALKAFDTNDLVVWANVAKLTTGLDAIMENAQTQFTGSMERANLANGQDAFGTAMQREIFTLAFSGIRQYLKDADNGMMTLRLDDAGATLSFAGGFKANSPFGNFIAAQKAAKPISFQGLPAGNFLFAGAFSWDSASMSKAANQVIQQIFANETISKDARSADLRKYFDAMAQMLTAVDGENFVLVEPPPGGQSGFMHGTALIDTADPQKLMDLQMQMVKNSAAMAAFSGTGDLKTTVDVTPDAVTVKGVKLSKTTIQFTLRTATAEQPLNPASRQALAMISTMYGAEGLTSYMGVVGKHVVVIFGSDAGNLDAAITAAQTNSDAFTRSDAIAATKDQLLANPRMVAYLPVTRWFMLAETFIRPGAAAPFPDSITKAPPIVISGAVDGNSVTNEIYVPLNTISGIRDAITRLQGGPQPGGGGTPVVPNLP